MQSETYFLRLEAFALSHGGTATAGAEQNRAKIFFVKPGPANHLAALSAKEAEISLNHGHRP